MKWQYGVVTCKQRLQTLLPRTLKSLELGGFDSPRLFMDGVLPSDIPDSLKEKYSITTRYPNVGPFGNWLLALWELWIREPYADRYAIFEDDFVTYKNLKDYLDTISLSENQYWNLNTFPSQQKVCPREPHDRSKELIGFYPSTQHGKGAVALVFPKKIVIDILSNKKHIVTKPIHAVHPKDRHDGSIITALKSIDPNYTEMVHNPSLIQHQGFESTIRNKIESKAWVALLSLSFRGEKFDARELINDNGTNLGPG